GDVAAWSGQACHEPGADGVPGYWEDDWNDGGRLLGGERCLGSSRKNDIDLEPGELGRNLGKTCGASLAPTILDSDVAAVNPTEIAQTSLKSSDQCRLRRCGTGTNKANGPLRLLRKCRERPCCNGSAKQCDELAPPDHSITSSARASKVGGTSRPS